MIIKLWLFSFPDNTFIVNNSKKIKMKVYKESNNLEILIVNSVWINHKRWEIIRRLAKSIFNIYILDFTHIVKIYKIYYTSQFEIHLNSCQK